MSTSVNKMTVADFDAKYGILDANTPPYTLMSGRYKQSFAHYTMRSRLPVTLTTIIDNMTKEKDELVTEFGEESREEIKTVIGLISKLKYQLQTDKTLEIFTGNEPDKEIWNAFIEKLADSDNCSFFKACWLYAECYMYRRLSSFFENSITLKAYDYFGKQKQNALIISSEPIEEILNALHTMELNNDSLRLLLKLNLWGNRCDLSITSGQEVRLSGNPFDLVRSFDKNLIIDGSPSVIECLESANRSETVVIEYICDNAGYELFTDFVLADYLIESKLADKIRFNLKAIPWFISDVTPNDFHWTLEYMKNHEDTVIQNYGKQWKLFLDEGKFELAPVDYFWTSPYEYYRMRDVNPDLYTRLSSAQLIIFKGDLNYRKLIGDFSWSFTEPFYKCLRGFQPSNVCSLRTVKADLICGLKEGQAENLEKGDKNWMTTGEYGTIQFIAKEMENKDCVQ